MILASLLEPSDLLCAEALQNATKGTSDETLFLFGYLASAFRQGHLHIQVEPGNIQPHLSLLWQAESCTMDAIAEKIVRGFSLIRDDPAFPIVREGPRLFFKRAWQLEEEVARHLLRLHAGSPTPIVFSEAEAILARLLDSGALQQAQAEAIRQAMTMPFYCLWGGPGTGKTYTAGILLKVLMEALPKGSRPLAIAIAAPTGKATQRLARSIMQGASPLAITVKTLHGLLDMHPGVRSYGRRPLLPYDCIIVDESSMIDIALAHTLLSRVASGTRLVLLGDPDQLPPIEPGDPFCHFVRKAASGGLTKVMRSDREDLMHLAACVQGGDSDGALGMLGREHDGQDGLFFHTMPRMDAIDALLRSYIDQLYGGIARDDDTQKVVAHFSARRILTPLRRGAWGTSELNRMLRRLALSRARDGMPFVEPILVTKNDERLGLSNGEMGVAYSQKGSPPDALFFEPKERASSCTEIPALLLSAYESAFCLSVHKSQGSEFDHVALFLPPGSEVLGRKMLYTAVTRAKKSLQIWSSIETFRACLANDGARLSTLGQRLEEKPFS